MVRTTEDKKIKSSRLYYISKTECQAKQFSNAAKLLNSFSQPNVSRFDAQILIQEITNELLNKFFVVSEVQNNQNRVLISILRAGLPMWIAANQFFKSFMKVHSFHAKGKKEQIKCI